MKSDNEVSHDTTPIVPKPASDFEGHEARIRAIETGMAFLADACLLYGVIEKAVPAASQRAMALSSLAKSVGEALKGFQQSDDATVLGLPAHLFQAPEKKTSEALPSKAHKHVPSFDGPSTIEPPAPLGD